MSASPPSTGTRRRSDRQRKVHRGRAPPFARYGGDHRLEIRRLRFGTDRPRSPVRIARGRLAQRAPNPSSTNVPPPPPALPDAAVPSASSKQPGVALGGGGGACDAKCTGHGTGRLGGRSSSTRGGGASLLQQRLANDSSLKGRVILDVKIATNGSVCSSAFRRPTCRPWRRALPTSSAAPPSRLRRRMRRARSPDEFHVGWGM